MTRRRRNIWILFLFSLLVVGAGVAVAVVAMDTETYTGDLVAFCRITSEPPTQEEPLTQEQSEEESQEEQSSVGDDERQIFYSELFEVAPPEIRDDVEVLQIQAMEIEEIRESGDIASLFDRVFDDELADEANKSLDRYIRSWC